MTVPEYARRMNRVLDYIDRHLAEDLALHDLAGVAHFSAYHFHRVFSEWVGQTLGEYVQRRRLALAAERLAARPDLSILAIAVAVGFGSGEAFARAFKRRFGCTPSAWRAQTPQRWATQLADARQAIMEESNFDQVNRLPMGDDGSHSIATSRCPMNVRLVDLPPVKVAYLRKIGPYGQAVAEFWRAVFQPWLLAHGLADRPRYGVAYDDRSVTAPDLCRYDACVEVPADFAASGEAMLTILPGGRYAVAPFAATPDSIGPAWTELFRGWLPESGMQCDARPLFAYYPAHSQIDPATGVFACELCLPVCRL